MGYEERMTASVPALVEQMDLAALAISSGSWEPWAHDSRRILLSAAALAGALAELDAKLKRRHDKVCDDCDSVNAAYHAAHGCWVK